MTVRRSASRTRGSTTVTCVNCSVDGWNFTILRTEITGSNRGAYCMHVCEIRDSWIHGTELDPNSEAHASAVRVEQYATLVHNTLAL